MQHVSLHNESFYCLIKNHQSNVINDELSWYLINLNLKIKSLAMKSTAWIVALKCNMSLLILAVACVMLLNGAKPSCAHNCVYWTGDEILPTVKYHNLSLSFFKWFESSYQIDIIHKSHNVPVLYHTMHNSEQKYAHFYSKWCIVGCGIGALWDLWGCSINLTSFIISQLQCELSNASGEKIPELSFSCKMTS